MRLSWKSLRLECLGLAAVTATLPIYEPALHSLHTLAPGRFAQAALPYSCAALVTTCLVALAMALTARHPRQSRKVERLHPAACAVMVASTLAGALGLWFIVQSTPPVVLCVGQGRLAGLGSALMLAAWAWVYRACDKESALLHLALSGVLGGLLMNMIGTLPLVPAMVLFLALDLVALAIPIASSLLQAGTGDARDTAGAGNSENSATDDETPETHESARSDGARIGEALVGISLFALSFQMLGVHGTLYLYLSFMLGSIVMGGVVALVVCLRRVVRPAELLGGVVVPAAGMAALLVAVVAPLGAQSVIARVALMVFYSLEIIVCAAQVIEIARRQRSAGARENPRSLGVICAAIAVYATASLLGMVAQRLIPPGPIHVAFVALTLAYLAGMLLRSSFANWREGTEGRMAGDASDPVLAADAIGSGRPSLMSDELLARLARQHQLTNREEEILLPLVRGIPLTQIAEQLVISDSTARGHAHKVYQKFGVSTREELLAVIGDESQEPQSLPTS